MAEIRVEPKGHKAAWTWLAIALIAAGLVYYVFYYKNG